MATIRPIPRKPRFLALAVWIMITAHMRSPLDLMGNSISTSATTGILKTADGRDFVVDKAGNKVSGNRDPYQQGLVFRCDSDGSNSETSHGTSGIIMRSRLWFYGTLWQSDNDDDGNRASSITS